MICPRANCQRCGRGEHYVILRRHTTGAAARVGGGKGSLRERAIWADNDPEVPMETPRSWESKDGGGWSVWTITAAAAAAAPARPETFFGGFSCSHILRGTYLSVPRHTAVGLQYQVPRLSFPVSLRVQFYAGSIDKHQLSRTMSGWDIYAYLVQ